MTTNNNSNEIKIIRIYDAPVKSVWDAWTDPSKVAKWWGPRGFSITTHSKNLEAGGHWHYTMHGPDGIDYPNKTKYYEVEKHSRLVYDHGGNDDQKPLFRVTVNFSEFNGKTSMDMTMSLPTPEAANEIKKFIKKAGGDATWDRLAEYLNKETSDKENFVINRTFNTPLETMFEMWTQPKHFSQWLAPTGFEMKFLRSDIKTNGATFYVMSNGKDLTMYGRAKYIEVTKPNQIIYTQEFCDENENLSRHPMAPTWPASMLTTVILTKEDTHHTRVTLTWEPHGTVTAIELNTFIEGKPGMTLGWTGSFDKLDEYLKA